MQLVVLAAGLGTRLRPVTDDRSKAMAPVVGRPLVEHAMAPWLDNGIRRAILVVGPEDGEIREYFRTGGPRGLDVELVVQNERRGMAHALGMAAPLLDGDFALTACDSLVPPGHVGDLLAAHSVGGGVLSLMDVAPELVSRSAAVALDGDRVRRIVEKPDPGTEPSKTVSLPHYVLPQGLLDLLPRIERSPRGEIELQDGIQRLINDGVGFTGVRTAERRQVSTPDDLLALTIDELRRTGGMDLPAKWLEAEVEGPVVVGREARIGHGCVIGPNVFIEDGSVVGNGVTIRNAAVLRDTWVPTGSEIEDEVVV